MKEKPPGLFLFFCKKLITERRQTSSPSPRPEPQLPHLAKAAKPKGAWNKQNNHHSTGNHCRVNEAYKHE
ncbi:unnamed protein product [Tetraodon nigroviridis]|uniref:(spotted green pufferfish) hypothetical protein n=1 Tax=Tetraodon nigroviridis TaxID=99883 RepID=Q4RJ11_TETNG|nr:unnamed protein product [Tetraodon nigroviridis]